MPIYLYRCTICKKNSEVIHSMDDLTNSQRCLECGGVMERLVTSFSFCFPVSNHDKVLKALNGEIPLPATPQDRPRMEKALAQGLDYQRPVIGRGI